MADWKRQTSETYRVGILLAAAGGFLDAYTFLCRGHVFANAQTGNIVLFGVSLARGDLGGAGYYLMPIAAFFCGIMLAELVKESMRESRFIHWRQVIIAAEIAALAAVAFVPNGDVPDMCANVVVSFICSLQVEAFRKVHGRAYATTMCTGNLRSGTELLYQYFQTRDRGLLRSSLRRELLRSSLEYFGIILFFIIGAAAGALVTSALSIKAALIPAALLAAVFVLMFREKV